MQTTFMSMELEPPFPKYQAFIASIPAKFGSDNLRGQRARDLVRQAVIIRRMIFCHIAFKSDHTPREIDNFMRDGFTEIFQSLINYSFFQSRQDDILNATEEAWAILKEEENAYGQQRMMLDSFNPNTAPN